MPTKTLSEADLRTDQTGRLVFYTSAKLKEIVIEEARRQDVSVSTLLRKQLRKTICKNDWAK